MPISYWYSSASGMMIQEKTSRVEEEPELPPNIPDLWVILTACLTSAAFKRNRKSAGTEFLLTRRLGKFYTPAKSRDTGRCADSMANLAMSILLVATWRTNSGIGLQPRC